MALYSFVGFIMLLVTAGSAWAQSPDCTRTLIPATVDVRYNETINLSIAWNLSERDYNEAKQKFGANAVIYGVPVGASYADFRKNIKTKAEEFRLQNFEQRSLAYATSALNDADVKVYRACVASQGGLALVDNQNGQDHYIVSLEYIAFPDQNDPLGRLATASNLTRESVADLKRDIDGRKFRRVTFQFTLTPIDPNKEASVDIGVGNVRRSLLLPPLVVPTPVLPKKHQWKLMRTDDCAGRDIACSEGSTPKDTECNEARLNLTSVCWSGGANRDYPPFAACQGKLDWCTYKRVPLDSCRNGGHPGNMSVCVYQ